MQSPWSYQHQIVITKWHCPKEGSAELNQGSRDMREKRERVRGKEKEERRKELVTSD